MSRSAAVTPHDFPLPNGWEQPSFDDSAWRTAHLIPSMGIGGSGRTQPPTDPYSPLYPRPIAGLGGELRGPTAVRAEYLAGRIDSKSGDPVKRLQATLDLHVSGTAPDDRLPLPLDVPAGGSVRITLDMGGIVMGQAPRSLPAGKHDVRF